MQRSRSAPARGAGAGARARGAASRAPDRSRAPTPQEARELRAVLQQAPEAIGRLNSAGGFVMANRHFLALTGYGEGELLGESWEAIIAPGDHAAVRTHLQAALALTHSPTERQEVSGVRRDGTGFPASLACAPVKGGARSGAGAGDIYLFLRDLSDRKKIEDQLIGAGRMAAVGTLAAGVAHEINNPLAYIVANVDFARRQFAEARARLVALSGAHGELSLGLHEVSDALGEALQGAERVRSIVRDLKIFARSDDDTVAPVSLRRVLDSSINMAFNEIRHRARLVKDYGDAPMVEGNESRLGQVFLNLLLNAAQAIGDGAAEKNEIRVTTRTDDDGRAVIEVRDSGPGIPADIAGRIFDPFFTTKPPGVGTGLGLWICRGIVSALGGEIVAASEAGRGALFRVTLPAVVLAGAAGGAESLPVDGTVAGARVMIVDDEPMILSALRRSLSGEYHVTAAAGGREALERLRGGDRFDVILCDLMMPELSGIDLYAELQRVAPDQLDRIVFVTGGAFTPRAREFLERIPNPRVEKPIDFQNLRSLIKNLTR